MPGDQRHAGGRFPAHRPSARRTLSCGRGRGSTSAPARFREAATGCAGDVELRARAAQRHARGRHRARETVRAGDVRSACVPNGTRADGWHTRDFAGRGASIPGAAPVQRRRPGGFADAISRGRVPLIPAGFLGAPAVPGRGCMCEIAGAGDVDSRDSTSRTRAKSRADAGDAKSRAGKHRTRASAGIDVPLRSAVGTRGPGAVGTGAGGRRPCAVRRAHPCSLRAALRAAGRPCAAPGIREALVALKETRAVGWNRARSLPHL